MPHLYQTARYKHTDGECAQHHSHTRPKDQGALVNAISDRAAIETQRQGSHTPTGSNPAQRKGRSREIVDQPALNHIAHLEGAGGGQPADPQPAVVAILQRPECVPQCPNSESQVDLRETHSSPERPHGGGGLLKGTGQRPALPDTKL